MIKRLMILFAFLGLLFGGISASAGMAQADETERYDGGLCLVSPEKTNLIKHDAEYITESRWMREVPAVDEVSHLEYRFFRDIPAVDEVSHTESMLKRWVPGKDAVTHSEWRMVTTNPGHEETFTTEFKYEKVVPATDGVKECQYKKWVKEYKDEVRYMYQKKVSGDVYQKKPGNDKKVGSFDWEWWQTPTWNGGPLSHWGVWGYDAATEGSGGHNDTSNTYTSGNDTLYKKSTAFKYFRTEQKETRQVETGGHWDYKWATEDPGDGWTKTGECRWKVEPTEAYTVPYKDGAWTTDTPGDPWVKIDSREVSNNDYVAPFSEWATKDGRTTDLTKAAYFTEAEIATFSRAWSKYGDAKTVEDSAATPGYFQYATDEGPSLDEADADTYTDAEIATFDRGWVKFGDPVKVVDSEEIPGWREYKTADGSSKDILDAVWFLDNSFEGWTVLDSKKVVTTEHVDGYTEYYVAGGDPTLELGESNWTTDEPEGWTFVDTRETLTKEAWTEKDVTPAKYETCNNTTLAYTGAGDMTWPIAGFGLLLVLAGATLVKLFASRTRA